MQLLNRPSVEELYRRAEALLPALRERAVECTALGPPWLELCGADLSGHECALLQGQVLSLQ